MLLPGQEIGNYVVEAELARGGMAVVLRVRHRVLGSVHALKVLDPVLRDSEEVRSRFLGEGLIGAKLRHPNIVRVTDTISTREVAGLVMDLVHGPTLEAFIRRQQKPLSADAIRELFLPVLDAVGEAHKAGVVHRDLKPSNILLEEAADGTLVPKVTDFGIAKISEAAKELALGKAATLAAARMGTPSYMSPEQIRGAREVTPRSDIFALGATLYELATLHMAFEGDTEFVIMERIVNARFRPPEELGVRDPTLVAAIRRALDPDPARRFQSCAEFAAALTGPPPRNLRLAKGAQSAPVTATATATAPARRGRFGLFLLVTLLVGAALAGGAVLTLVQLGYELKPVWPPRKKKRPTGDEVSVGRDWNALPPFSECVRYPTPERVVLLRLTSRRDYRDATELRTWFRNLPPQSIDVYLEDGGSGRSVVFELVAARWDEWPKVVGSAVGDELCFRLGFALVNADVGRPLAQRVNPRRTALEYQVLGPRSPTARRDERLGTLEDALRATGQQRLELWLRARR
ncbi:MAG: serine/threonine-protein kinase [Polyangia bacterium]